MGAHGVLELPLDWFRRCLLARDFVRMVRQKIKKANNGVLLLNATGYGQLIIGRRERQRGGNRRMAWSRRNELLDPRHLSLYITAPLGRSAR